MRPPLLLVLPALLCASACPQADSKSETKSETKTEAKSETKTEPKVEAKSNSEAKPKSDADAKPKAAPKAEPEAALPIVVTQTKTDERGTLWFSPGLDPLRDLNATPSLLNAGAVDLGDGDAIVSTDGAWVAFIDDGLRVWSTDGKTQQHWPAKRDGGEIAYMMSGFSPDSKTLLVYQGAGDGYEPEPIPKGEQPGFVRITLADMSAATVPHLQSFVAWMPDSTRVLSRDGTKLMATSVTSEASEPFYGGDEHLKQVSAGARSLAALASAERIGPSKIVTVSRSDAKVNALGDAQPFASVQWPRLSPDESKLAYCRRVGEGPIPKFEIVVVDVAKPVDTSVKREPHKDCDFAWQSSEVLLTLENKELFRLAVSDGKRESLAKTVHAFAVAATPAG